MPYPAQTDRKGIIKTAIVLIEREGSVGLKLSRVASEIGIKSPYLYRHFKNKAALTQAIIEHTHEKLFEAYAAVMQDEGNDPQERLLNLLRAHRDFALANPNSYILAFTATDPRVRTDAMQLEQQVIPIQRIMAEISGEEHSLSALRGALALVHGFVMLELKDQLQRGGDLTVAFETAVSAYLNGWPITREPESARGQTSRPQ